MMRSSSVLRVYCALLTILGVSWVASLPQRLGVSLVTAEVIGAMLGLAVAGAFIRHPYGKNAGALELALGAAGLGSWLWMAVHYSDWLLTMSDRSWDKWVAGVIAIVLMLEGLRKTCGLAITVLSWLLIAYGLLGHYMPGSFQAERTAFDRLTLYLYADSNGIPGLVLSLIISLVLAFVLLGKIMEVTGATGFFTDLSMALLGHRRGGPAKVAVAASSIFATVSGSTVGNIMSTGIVTIPLMKRAGFKAHQAAAIEAVASNGGQIAPPVMGATAFLIAEFLQVGYLDVVVAALVPATVYYFVLFHQVGAIASRDGIRSVPKAELPVLKEVLAKGWVFFAPLAVLVYLLFWKSYNPGLSALGAATLLVVLHTALTRKAPSRAQWLDMAAGTGENLLPLMLIGGAAGIIIGVLNFTGLGFTLSLALSDLGQGYGLFAMLVVTAMLSILLGMGMPTAAVYVVLSIVLAPALVEMAIAPMAAHLFIFYFGLLSMLTPPVAVASYVAASLAQADMWKTSVVAVQLAAVAYALPFLWVMNPALLLDGSWSDIALVVTTVLVGGWVLASTALAHGAGWKLGYVVVALGAGSATLWLSSWWALVPSVVAVAVKVRTAG